MKHAVKASSFADPQDVRKFRQCKLKGMSDAEAFRYGDNGIGRWGDRTDEGTGPACALPPEDWEHLGAKARGAKVRVTVGDKSIVCLLKDTMPHRRNIKNGAGIDLNPDACEDLGLTPPVMVAAVWEWV